MVSTELIHLGYQDWLEVLLNILFMRVSMFFVRLIYLFLRVYRIPLFYLLFLFIFIAIYIDKATYFYCYIRLIFITIEDSMVTSSAFNWLFFFT